MKRCFFFSVVAICTSIASPGQCESLEDGPEWNETQIFGLGRLNALTYSPDGSKLVLSGIAGVQVWKVETWNVEQFLELQQEVFSCSWSPDQTKVATANSDGTVGIWDASSGLPLRTLAGHQGRVNAVAWSPDGSAVASASEDGTVRLWDPATGTTLHVLASHTSGVLSLSWSPSGEKLASGSKDHTVKIWRASCGSLERTLVGHSDWVAAVDWSSSNGLASGSFDRAVRVWDPDSGELRQLLQDRARIVTLAWAPDGYRIAAGLAESQSNWISIWDTNSGELLMSLEGHDDWISAVAWSSANNIASASLDQTLRQWDGTTGAQISNFEANTGLIYMVCWSPDRSQFASVTVEGEIVIWDPATARVIRAMRSPYAGYSLAWSKVDPILAVGMLGPIQIWNWRTGELLRTLDTGTRVNSIAFSTDARRFASGGDDRVVRIWDVDSGTLLQSLTDHDNVVEAVVWWQQEGEDRVASGSMDQTIKIWDPNRGTLLQTLEGHTDRILSVSLSPDQTTLASAGFDGTIRFWDVFGTPLGLIEAHDAWIFSVDWSVDGSKVSSASRDHTVKIWGVETGELLQTLRGHQGYVYSTNWTTDGSLLSSSEDVTIRRWSPRP